MISSRMTETRVSSSSAVVSRHRETRKEPSMISGGRPMASSTWLRCPLAQAEPAETQMPWSCRILMVFWVGTPGTDRDRMCGAS